MVLCGCLFFDRQLLQQVRNSHNTCRPSSPRKPTTFTQTSIPRHYGVRLEQVWVLHVGNDLARRPCCHRNGRRREKSGQNATTHDTIHFASSTTFTHKIRSRAATASVSSKFGCYMTITSSLKARTATATGVNAENLAKLPRHTTPST